MKNFKEINRTFTVKKNSIFNAVCKTRYLALLVVLIFTCRNVWGADLTISLNFNQASNGNLFGLRTSSGNDASTETSKTYGGYTYKLMAANSCYYYSGNVSGTTYKCLLMGKTNSYIVFPAISGKKLTKVTIGISIGSSTATVAICEGNTSTVTTGGAGDNSWAKGETHSWTLTKTSANTAYSARVTSNHNIQITTIELEYTNVGGGGGCTAPTITAQPTGATYTQNDVATAMSITASGTSVTYQWYSNTSNSTSGASPISGATSSSYTPPTSTVGTKYYYCVASSSTCTTTSNIVPVVVNAPRYTVSFSTGTGNPSQADITEASAGAGITLPDGPTPACSSDGWSFAGWKESSAQGSAALPATKLWQAGETYSPVSDITLYAVYFQASGNNYKYIENLNSLFDGAKMIITSYYEGEYAVSNTTDGGGYIQSSIVSPDGDYIISSPANSIVWTLNGYKDHWNIKNLGNNKYIIVSTLPALADDAETVSITYEIDEDDYDQFNIQNGSKYLYMWDDKTYSGYDKTYLYLYQQQGTYNSNPSCEACEKQVTITKGTPESGGSFDLDKTGEQDCCEPLVVTVSNIVAPSGKQFGAITQSGFESGVTIDQNAKTVTYAANSNGSSTINVTFVDLPKYTVTLEDDGTELTQSSYGAAITLPSRTGCDGYTFAGWTKTWTSPQSSWTSTAPTIINAGSYTPTGNENLYPVYTKVESGGTPETVTLYDEPFTGSAHSTGVESTNVAATTDMFVDGSATVWSHYSFDAASTAAYANNYGGETISDGIKIKREANNTTVTMMEVTGIKISGASDLELSLCNRRTAASATLNISYKIDDGSYTAVGGTISYNSTNDTWKKCTGLTISGTGTSLALKIELVVSGTTNRTMVLDDIKITGETGGSTTYYISVPSCCENIVPAPEVTETSTKNTITLSWTNVTGANGYTVTCSGGTPGEVTSSGNNRTCEITGLDPNTAYTWTVVATYTSPYCQANAANGSTTTKQVYTVSYNKNGGTIANLPSGGSYAAGETVTVAAKPDGDVSKGGYEFTGWNTAATPSGSSTHYDADGTATFTMPASAVTLYAEWTTKKNYFVDRMHGNCDGEHTITIGGTVYNCYLREGQSYTVPDLSDNSTGSNTCVTGHSRFIGWVAAGTDGKSGKIGAQGQLVDGYTVVQGRTTRTARDDGMIYYAVWAEE